jgi:hypothetical protein
VWYLSRTAGAPCPFARVGIRICDYGEHGKRGQEAAVDPRERRRERDRARRAAQCGEKRKRLTRSCADNANGDDGDDTSAGEQRPPKVKITLRLKPGPAPSTLSTHSAYISQALMSIDAVSEPGSSDNDSSADSSSGEDEEDESAVVSDPTASVDVLQSVFPAPFMSVDSTRIRLSGCRRSPSAPLSVASAPPDSDDEEYRCSITDRRRSISAALSTSDFDDTDDEEGLDWFNDHDASADEADDEATDYTGHSCASPMDARLPPMDAVARHLEQWEATDNRMCELASTPIELPTATSWTKSEECTWTHGPVTSPSSFWGSADNHLTSTLEEEPDDMFSLIESQSNIPLDLVTAQSPVEPCVQALAIHDHHKNSTWQSAGVCNSYELHAADLDGINKSTASGTLRISPPSIKSAMATAVPSPIRKTSPPPLDTFACPWRDSTPSLSSSVSSSVAASPFGSRGSASSLSSFSELSSPLASRPEMPKRFSQATIRTLRTEPQTPWEFGLLSPADVDADFQTFFPTDEIKLPKDHVHSRFPVDYRNPVEAHLDVKMGDLALEDLVNVSALGDFCALPTSEPPASLEAHEPLPVPVADSFELDLEAITPEFLATIAVSLEPCRTTTEDAARMVSPLPLQASDSDMDMDMEPSSPLTSDAAVPETPILRSRHSKAESKPRRSTRLASQRSPKRPSTPQTPRHRTRAQSSR